MVEGINNKRGKKSKKEKGGGGGMRFTGQWRGMPVIKGQMVGAHIGVIWNKRNKEKGRAPFGLFELNKNEIVLNLEMGRWDSCFALLRLRWLLVLAPSILNACPHGVVFGLQIYNTPFFFSFFYIYFICFAWLWPLNYLIFFHQTYLL